MGLASAGGVGVDDLGAMTDEKAFGDFGDGIGFIGCSTAQHGQQQADQQQQSKGLFHIKHSFL